MSRGTAIDRRASRVRARRAALSLVLLLVGCGAKSGLEVDRLAADASPPDAFRADASRDGAIDARREDTGPACPFGFDDAVEGTLRITADDNFRLFVHGALIDDTPRDWHEVQTYTVPVFVHPARRNTIAIEVINVFRVDGLDRGVVADLMADIGGRQSVSTDRSWRLSTAPEIGWTEVDFDASAWREPTDEGVNGIPPWGAVLGSSSARWLWSYDSDVPASEKPVGERIALRRDFFVVGHMVSDTPGTCP